MRISLSIFPELFLRFRANGAHLALAGRSTPLSRLLRVR
jgi:hypothetical protein